MTTIRVHYFSSSGEAYDATQCRDDIKNGDILVIPHERVVGLADTWPVAISTHAGNLHQLLPGRKLKGYLNHAGERVFTDQQISLARSIARGMKFL